MLYRFFGFNKGSFPAGLGWHAKVMEGFPSSSIQDVAQHLSISPEDLVERLGLPPEALASEDNLDSNSSNSLYLVGLTYLKLNVAFKSASVSKAWLCKPRRELQNKVALELLRTEAGAREVFAAIERLKPVANPDPEPLKEGEELREI
jgi:uncharacterized protein (DUF2384 family)